MGKKEILADIEDLIQDDHNFNKGTDEGKKLMAKSFTEFGAGRSVLIDKDNRIIAGNKSALAASDAGIKKVRIIETTGDELIAVKRLDVELDSKKGREMALADNATTMVNLSWDEAELGLMADEWGFELPEWGVEIKKDEREAKEDDFDIDGVVETVCKEGDVWVLGEHRLMCGDSTKKEDVKVLMDGGSADLWLTDPPYNVAVENSEGMKIMNDDMGSSEFYDFLYGAFSAVVPVLSAGAPFYVWFASCEHINFEKALNDAGFKIRQELVWNKNRFVLGRSHYQWKHEPCLYGWHGERCRYFCDFRNLATVIDEEKLDFDKMTKDELKEMLEEIYGHRLPSTVLNCENPKKDDKHPTMKPVVLFGKLIKDSSKVGDVVLDTFGGSGTTMIACEQLGRRCRMMELDPHYCDVIIERWETLTGRKAVRL